MVCGENTLFILACSAIGGVNLFTSFRSFFRLVVPLNTLTRMVIIGLIWAIEKSGCAAPLLFFYSPFVSLYIMTIYRRSRSSSPKPSPVPWTMP